MALRGWGRSEPTPRPENHPAGDNLPDLHPAQIDLLAAQQHITGGLTTIDEGLALAGNTRPVMRDALLDARYALTGPTP